MAGLLAREISPREPSEYRHGVTFHVHSFPSRTVAVAQRQHWPYKARVQQDRAWPPYGGVTATLRSRLCLRFPRSQNSVQTLQNAPRIFRRDVHTHAHTHTHKERQTKRRESSEAQELCESRGGRPTVSVDVTQHFNQQERERDGHTR